MHTSRPIEVQGRFVGVAVTQAGHWCFIATHPAAETLNGSTFPSSTEAQRIVGLALVRHGARPTADQAR
jgi:hypothetical protein